MSEGELARRRRWPWVLGVVVVLLGAVAAGGWFLWLPNYRPPLAAGERYGIDVSHHQGAIDWPTVAADGVTFAYVKATEGGDWTDPRFAANWDGAGKAGLDRGVYHFFSLCTPGDQQAKHFLTVAPPDPRALAPAVDLELAGNCADRPTPAKVTAELTNFLDEVEQAWRRPVVLYRGEDWQGAYPVNDGHPLWLLNFLSRPDGDWHLWQLHGFANVDGVTGRVDLDVMRGRPAAGRSGRSPRRTG